MYGKKTWLRQALQEMGSVAVAFSSGVDSTFLLKTAFDVLKEQTLAVTIQSHSFPTRELEEAQDFCRREGIRQVIYKFDELQIPGFCENPPDRCYLCKKGFFQTIKKIAGEYGISYVAEGSNVDDESDYRPGRKAIIELGIRSPLLEAGLTKQEIRLLSKEAGIPVWDKPSYACLSSRFAYGERITKEKLAMVEHAEQLLWELGFSQVRVRVHGNLARIETTAEEISRLVLKENRDTVTNRLTMLGFSYVTVDLAGYRMGSMNEVLK